MEMRESWKNNRYKTLILPAQISNQTHPSSIYKPILLFLPFYYIWFLNEALNFIFFGYC